MASCAVAKAAAVLGLSMALGACGRTQQTQGNANFSASGVGGGGSSEAALGGTGGVGQGGAAAAGGPFAGGQGGSVGPTAGAGGQQADTPALPSPGCGKAAGQPLREWQAYSV